MTEPTNGAKQVYLALLTECGEKICLAKSNDPGWEDPNPHEIDFAEAARNPITDFKFHTVRAGDTLSAIIAGLTGKSLLESSRIAAKQAGKDRVYSLSDWGKRFSTTPETICNQIRRATAFAGECEDIPFVEIQPGELVLVALHREGSVDVKVKK